uniref:Uncharacterized protein n=1 Tax=Rhizophora mucronata TaxID=61149 RepID=A0A2P2NWK2_RHIMU
MRAPDRCQATGSSISSSSNPQNQL